MEYRQLGTSELVVSRLGFGGCPMGKHGWGLVQEEDLKTSVQYALNHGVTLFDTADVYGLGESEKLLGRFLGDQKTKVTIATKFGVRRDSRGNTYYDDSPAWIEQALINSLDRLGVECIDMYFMHYWDKVTPIDDVMEVLERKREEGKIRYYGLSNIVREQLESLSAPDGCNSFQEQYSLIDREFEVGIRQLMDEHKWGFISWGSLGQGLLTGKYTERHEFDASDRRSRQEYANFHGTKLAEYVLIVKNIKETLCGDNRTPPQIAIRWILDYMNASSVLIGIKRPTQIEENLGAFNWRLSDDELVYLKDILPR